MFVCQDSQVQLCLPNPAHVLVIGPWRLRLHFEVHEIMARVTIHVVSSLLLSMANEVLERAELTSGARHVYLDPVWIKLRVLKSA